MKDSFRDALKFLSKTDNIVAPAFDSQKDRQVILCFLVPIGAVHLESQTKNGNFNLNNPLLEGGLDDAGPKFRFLFLQASLCFGVLLFDSCYIGDIGEYKSLFL